MTVVLFQERDLRGELMDDPALDASRHRQALRGLGRINAVSAAAGLLYRAIRPWLVTDGETRVLDVACGGGDVAVRLARRAARDGLAVRLIGCDVSGLALAEAKAAAERAGVELETRQVDVLQGPLPEADVAMSSLFVHHLEDAQAVAALRRMADAAPRLAVSDLRRTVRGYLAAWIGTRLLSRSPVVHVDGPRSVAAALTLEEMRDLGRRAGLAEVTVRRVFPQRMLLIGRRA